MHVNSNFGKVSRAKLIIVDGVVAQDRGGEAGRKATTDDYAKKISSATYLGDFIQFKSVVIKDTVVRRANNEFI